MDRVDAMTCFARVAESGSFTNAAATLGVSRTTATQLVQQLEARLRVRLLHRTTRSVKLTAEGEAYYARVVKLLADLEDAESSVVRSRAAPRGRIRVDAPAPLARRVIIPALPKFQARYPEIKLKLGVSDREVDVVDVTVFIVDPENNFTTIFEAMQQYWGGAPYPTLTGIGVTWLYGFKFEIKVVAKLPE